MITSKVHGQFMWPHMWLPSDIRAKMIRLWRGGLLASLMHGYLQASEEGGCSTGTIALQRGPIARREGFL
jgi:hypothetical protein